MIKESTKCDDSGITRRTYDTDAPAQQPVSNRSMYLLNHNGNFSLFYATSAKEALKKKINSQDHLFVQVRE